MDTGLGPTIAARRLDLPCCEIADRPQPGAGRFAPGNASDRREPAAKFQRAFSTASAAAATRRGWPGPDIEEDP